jgi:hypothetical protein
MRTLRHLASVGFALNSPDLRNLLGYNSYLVRALVLTEAQRTFLAREREEPNWFPLLPDYTPNELAELVTNAIDRNGLYAESPEDMLEVVLDALASEVCPLEGVAKVLAFVLQTEPNAKPWVAQGRERYCPF